MSASGPGVGASGWFDWHDSPEIETLTAQWLASTIEAQTQKLLGDVQRSALANLSVAPLGQIIPKTAYRRNLQGILTASSPLFWNVRRA
ncbi:hypothetical protein [Bosea sp. BIWAKO-01]|uniref:hypothetical protein n=1 Tax=Bosea sp. BIWAKO-01 TaxID=506668 RepID=UPI0008536EB2|nr:hypothetical protein [Bosea sp. BIWAKO-01]GAU86076.1 dipeptide-binding ABC transporter periplasmic substrate-binding component [Bosea sp. BIWAKO-01]